ncbi:MAG: DUF1842 domain-containing protein [Sphaerospermopsis sp. SIO1G1]|nr:DUF1842 domain-containing protein [Sphaerospermopsis sp. SIO1G1]
MSETQKYGVFLACYEISTSLLGAPTLTLNLLVNAPAETVHGIGNITQAINPPLDIKTKLDGSFTYMTVMPDNTHILVTASGYPIINWPPYVPGPGPVILPNVELRMVLNEDWKSGTANYKYLDDQGKWQTVNNAVVKSVKCPVLT